MKQQNKSTGSLPAGWYIDNSGRLKSPTSLAFKIGFSAGLPDLRHFHNPSLFAADGSKTICNLKNNLNIAVHAKSIAENRLAALEKAFVESKIGKRKGRFTLKRWKSAEEFMSFCKSAPNCTLGSYYLNMGSDVSEVYCYLQQITRYIKICQIMLDAIETPLN